MSCAGGAIAMSMAVGGSAATGSSVGMSAAARCFLDFFFFLN